jgi:hypothetical protein
MGRLLKAESTETPAVMAYFALAAFGLLPAAINVGFARDSEKRTFSS